MNKHAFHKGYTEGMNKIAEFNPSWIGQGKDLPVNYLPKKNPMAFNPSWIGQGMAPKAGKIEQVKNLIRALVGKAK